MSVHSVYLLVFGRTVLYTKVDGVLYISDAVLEHVHVLLLRAKLYFSELASCVR